MRIGYGLSSEELDPRELVRQMRSRGRQSQQLTGLSEAARRLLRDTPPGGQPLISRAGVRSEAHRVRSILRATMRDQQLIGGQ
jgi:hypothetical protein